MGALGMGCSVEVVADSVSLSSEGGGVSAATGSLAGRGASVPECLDIYLSRAR